MLARFLRPALALAALVAHAPALRNGFVLDDDTLLAENPYVRTLAGLRQLVSHELFVAGAQPRFVPYYRPLSGSLNWLSYQLVGAHPALQHALNLLLHAGVTLLLFRALEVYGVRRSVAFGAALLFAVHPATAEVVAYIGGRQDMLGWLIGLFAIVLAPRCTSVAAAAALGFGATFGASLCHELFFAMSIPLALLAALRKHASRGLAARVGAAVLAGGAAAVALVLGLRWWLKLLPFETNFSGVGQLAQATLGVGLRLLKVALLPTDLAVDVTVTLPGAALVAVSGVLVVVGALWLAQGVQRRRPELLGLLLAGLSLMLLTPLLHAGVVLKYGIISDRYAYAWLVGLVLLAAAAVESVELPSAEAGSSLLAMLRRWGVVGLSFAVLPLTWSRDANWFDERSLQLAMIESRPDDPESLLAAGVLAFREGDIEQAYPLCRAYQKARPDSDKANLCLGSWLLMHQQAEQAVTVLRPYALSRPGVASARRTFLFALLATRRHAEATQVLGDWSAAFPGAPELEEARRALAQAAGASRSKL